MEMLLQDNKILRSRMEQLEAIHAESIVSSPPQTIVENGDADTIVAKQTRSLNQVDVRSFTAIPFAFDEDLEASRVYRRVRKYACDVSLHSSVARTHAWSVFTGLSLSAISDISAFAIPLYAFEMPAMPWLPETIFIIVQREHVLCLQVHLWSDTVHMLRLNIEKETSIPVSHQQLYLSTLSDTTGSYSYTLLQDDELISSYSITDGSNLLLTLPKPLFDYPSTEKSKRIFLVQSIDGIQIIGASQIESFQKKLAAGIVRDVSGIGGDVHGSFAFPRGP
jgi:hypothetical protein